MNPTTQRIALDRLSLWSWLAALFFAAMVYAIAYDQGLLEQIVHGLQNQTLHEFFHDARHLFGFPCH